jgi:hypothetical protein
LSKPVDRQRLPSDFSRELGVIKAQKIGYSIIAYDGNGMPVVHLWVLSPNEYGGMCGLSSHEERRVSAWLLWRNINAALRENMGFSCNGTQAERRQERTKVAY